MRKDKILVRSPLLLTLFGVAALCFSLLLTSCSFESSVPTEDLAVEPTPTFSIETKFDGTGTKADTFTVVLNSKQTFHSIKRTKTGDFLSNATVSWSLEGSIGSLTIIGDGKSAEFTASNAGSGEIKIFQEGKLLGKALVNVVIENKIELTEISTSAVTSTGFGLNVSYIADNNDNASMDYRICNITDNPSCDPLLSASTAMTLGVDEYTATIAGLSAPNDPGDTIKIAAVATDGDGTINSPIFTEVTLSVPVLGSFSIAGITSSSDVLTDAELGIGTSPIVNWTTSTNGLNYDVTIYEDNGSTVACPLITVGAVTSYDFGGGCNLTAGNYYRAKVVAKVGPDTLPAANDLYRFYVNQPPQLGVGGNGPWYVMQGDSIIVDALWAASPVVGVATEPEGESLSFSSTNNGSLGTVINNSTSFTYTAGASNHGMDTFSVSVQDSKGNTLLVSMTIHVMTSFTWTGDNSTIWSEGANWCGAAIATDKKSCLGAGAQPGSSNTIIFDNTCVSTFTCSPSTTSSINVKGVKLTSNGFTQSLGHSLTIGSDSWLQSGGIFNGGDSAININAGNTDVYNLSGGTFTSTTATFSLRSDNDNYGNILITASPASFNHNNGTVKIVANDRGNFDIDLNSSLTLYNMIVTNVSNCCGPDTNSWTIGTGDTVTVLNDFTIEQGGSAVPKVNLNGGTLEVHGNITAKSGAVPGNTLMKLIGTGDQLYTTVGNGFFPAMHIEKASGNVLAAGGTTSLGVRRFHLVQGTFTAPTGSFYVRNANFTSGTTIFEILNGTTYTHSSGVLQFESDNRDDYNLRLNGTLNVHDLVYTTVSACCGPDTNTFTLQAGDKFIVENDFTMEKQAGASPKVQANGGSIDVYRNFSIGDNANGGSTIFTLKGSTNSTISLTGASTVPTSTFTIDKAIATYVDLLTNFSLTGTGQDTVINSGILRLNNFDLNVNDDLIINTNGTLDVTGGTYSPNTPPDLVNNGTIIP